MGRWRGCVGMGFSKKSIPDPTVVPADSNLSLTAPIGSGNTSLYFCSLVAGKNLCGLYTLYFNFACICSFCAESDSYD